MSGGLHRSGFLGRRKPLDPGPPPARRKGLDRTAWAPSPTSKRLSRSTPMPSAPSPQQRARARTWADITVLAWEAAAGQCLIGGHPLPWEAVHGHHRQMKSAGGLDIVENCLAIDAECHLLAHTLGTASYDAGWLVHPWDDPAEVPVIGRADQ